ncbi:hypothetical protein NtRootD5_27830 [Arthrobacter sp. NtRootD5]|nr:hypothetical protein NtRootA2_27770 [Arthrobacter sp. NtRootA2]BCW28182.1 hypothetical protein NtRootC45_27820 [Arthrobacter sp. NtRootC45]BCW32452.1 hypothetical protein NtRootD5_27830 [Arthrobacter sp. NtRootD5]
MLLLVPGQMELANRWKVPGRPSLAKGCPHVTNKLGEIVPFLRYCTRHSNHVDSSLTRCVQEHHGRGPANVILFARGPDGQVQHPAKGQKVFGQDGVKGASFGLHQPSIEPFYGPLLPIRLCVPV